MWVLRSQVPYEPHSLKLLLSEADCGVKPGLQMDHVKTQVTWQEYHCLLGHSLGSVFRSASSRTRDSAPGRPSRMSGWGLKSQRGDVPRGGDVWVRKGRYLPFNI